MGQSSTCGEIAKQELDAGRDPIACKVFMLTSWLSVLRMLA